MDVAVEVVEVVAGTVVDTTEVVRGISSNRKSGDRYCHDSNNSTMYTVSMSACNKN